MNGWSSTFFEIKLISILWFMVGNVSFISPLINHTMLPNLYRICFKAVEQLLFDPHPCDRSENCGSNTSSNNVRIASWTISSFGETIVKTHAFLYVTLEGENLNDPFLIVLDTS